MAYKVVACTGSLALIRHDDDGKGFGDLHLYNFGWRHDVVAYERLSPERAWEYLFDPDWRLGMYFPPPVFDTFDQLWVWWRYDRLPPWQRD